MKIKSDFITNSSSTSFIIAQTKENINNDDMKIKITMEIDLSRYVREEFHSLDDYEKYSDYYFDDEHVEKIKEVLKGGGKVFILNVSDEDSDDDYESMLCHHGLEGYQLPDNFIVIKGDGGY